MASTATIITKPHKPQNTQHLLHLLHLSSPALPIGAFAYSQGLEYAIDNGWLTEREQIQDWISGVLRHGLCQLEVPLLLRIAQALAEQRPDQAERYNAQLLASRETWELRQEDQQIGQALRRLLVSLKVPLAEIWQTEHKYPVSQVAMLAVAGHHWQLDTRDLATSLLWGFVENQLAVAAKVLPLGQSDAQQILLNLLPDIEQGLRLARHIKDDEIGATLPGQVLASSRHETQYSRLFRS